MLAGLATKASPFLAKTVLPTLATGALPGVGSALAQKATNKAMADGLYLKKGSNIASVETDGRGLYLKAFEGSGLGGDGLYLKQEGQVFDGSGLLFGPDSPFKIYQFLAGCCESFVNFLALSKCVNQRKNELSKKSLKTSTSIKINTSTKPSVSKIGAKK